MKITPDEIAQKSFPTKFRGVDPVDVKDFLELLARQTLELQEQVKVQAQKISDQDKELELAADDRNSFADVIKVYKDNIEKLKTELAEQKERDSKLAGDYDKVKGLAEGLQQERETLKTELSRAQTHLSEVESKARMSQAALEELRQKIVVLEAENGELKAESQRRRQEADENGRRADDLLEKSHQEAERLIAVAQEKIGQLRAEAAGDIEQIRDDIVKLSVQRRQLQQEMRALLNNHLDRLNDLSTAGVSLKRSEHDDLFQEIDLPELAEFAEDEPQQPFAQDLSPQAEDEESEERLRSRLEDGGIAYLSDE